MNLGIVLLNVKLQPQQTKTVEMRAKTIQQGGKRKNHFFFIQDPLYHFRFRNRNNYINAKKCSRNIFDIFVVMCEK